MKNSPYAFIFIGLALAYALQLFLTSWQAKRYYSRLKVLRKDGLTSVGMGGGKWVGRIFGVLVVDEEKKILHAEILEGMTIFAKLKPVVQLEGLNAADLLDETRNFNLKKNQITAFRNAAKEYFKDENQHTPEPVQLKSMSDVKSVRMFGKKKSG